jgi:hypothetical protein
MSYQSPIIRPRSGAMTGVQLIRWIARLWSLASLAFIVLVALGTGGNIATLPLGMLFFPVGVSAGFVIAWWREGIGGMTTVLSLAGFYLWHIAVAGWPPRGPFFVLLAAPGFLFLLCWLLSQVRRSE